MKKLDTGEKLTGQVAMLKSVTGMDNEMLGTRLGVTEKTIYNRLKDPDGWKLGELIVLGRLFAQAGLQLDLSI